MHNPEGTQGVPNILTITPFGHNPTHTFSTASRPPRTKVFCCLGQALDLVDVASDQEPEGEVVSGAGIWEFPKIRNTS